LSVIAQGGYMQYPIIVQGLNAGKLQPFNPSLTFGGSMQINKIWNAYFQHYFLKPEKQSEFFEKCGLVADKRIMGTVNQIYTHHGDSLVFPPRIISRFDYESFVLAVYCHLHKREFDEEFVVENED